jgi:hypothetical protein
VCGHTSIKTTRVKSNIRTSDMGYVGITHTDFLTSDPVVYNDFTGFKICRCKAGNYSIAADLQITIGQAL